LIKIISQLRTREKVIQITFAGAVEHINLLETVSISLPQRIRIWNV